MWTSAHRLSVCAYKVAWWTQHTLISFVIFSIEMDSYLKTPTNFTTRNKAIMQIKRGFFKNTCHEGSSDEQVRELGSHNKAFVDISEWMNVRILLNGQISAPGDEDAEKGAERAQKLMLHYERGKNRSKAESEYNCNWAIEDGRRWSTRGQQSFSAAFAGFRPSDWLILKFFSRGKSPSWAVRRRVSPKFRSHETIYLKKNPSKTRNSQLSSESVSP